MNSLSEGLLGGSEHSEGGGLHLLTAHRWEATYFKHIIVKKDSKNGFLVLLDKLTLSRSHLIISTNIRKKSQIIRLYFVFRGKVALTLLTKLLSFLVGWLRGGTFRLERLGKVPPLTNPKVTCGLFNKMFEISMKHECTTKFVLNFQHISLVGKAHSVDIREAPEFTSRGAEFLPGRGLTSNPAPLTRGRKKSRPPLTRGQIYPATLTRGQKNA